ncbi:MAG: xanthine dehydrogenase family protein subunit M [Firmicutes bacterium]|nr:xanthine dehydrogenase family protein subunit M [Bacillota bacterium]
MNLEVYNPKNTEEVLDLLNSYKRDAKLIAGGTDLVLDLREKKIKPKAIIDISNLDELKYIKKDDNYIEIGACTTFTDIEKSEILTDNLKGLKKAASEVGSPQIRNRGTIGGNICNASPAADIVPPLLSLDATVVIKSKENIREVSLEKIFLNKGKIDIKEDEMVSSVKFKNIKGKLGFYKLGLRKALAISKIATAIYIEKEDNICKEIRIGNGALGRHGLRERKVEDYLINKEINEAIIEASATLLSGEIEKRLKGRSSLEFKKEAVKGTFKKAFKDAL